MRQIIAFSAALDLTYALFPAIMIAKLQMSRERKVGLTILMGLGVLYELFLILGREKFTNIPFSLQRSFHCDIQSHKIKNVHRQS